MAASFALAAGLPHVTHGAESKAGGIAIPGSRQFHVTAMEGGEGPGDVQAGLAARKRVISVEVARLLSYAAPIAGGRGWGLEFGLPKSGSVSFMPEPERKESRLGLALRLRF